MDAVKRLRAWGNPAAMGGVPIAGQVQNLALTTVSTVRIDLAWDATLGATSYLVEQSPDNSTWASAGTPGTNALSVTGLTAGTRYYFRVSAVNAGGTGTASSVANTYTLPAQVAGLAVTVVSSVALTPHWTANAVAPTTYRVERSPAGAGTWVEVGAPATNSFADTGLSPGTAYDYRVKAQNPGGDGAYSATVTGTTLVDYVTRWGLVEHWRLDEASGNALGVYAGIDLTASVSEPGSVAGKVGNARSFAAASSQSFSHIDSAPLSLGADVDFWWGGWVNLTTKPAVAGVLTKWNGSGTNAEYYLAYIGGTNYWRFVVGTGITSATVNTGIVFPTIDTATAYFLLVWHDPVADTINIQVNNGTVASAVWAGGTQDTNNAFVMGDTGFTQFWDGWLDAWSFGKNVPGGIGGMISEIGTRLYNAGAGRDYPWT